MNLFSSVKQGQPIEVFAVRKQYDEDNFRNKVDLIIGAYRDGENQPWVLPVVRKVEKAMANDEKLNKEYLPVFGVDLFTTLATKLLLGDDSPALVEKRAFGVQALSGTGALKIGAEFLTRHAGRTIFYLSKPEYQNHRLLFLNAGFHECREYRYWNEATRTLDIEGFLEDLNNAPEGSVIILHACAHNPTGCDPTQEQWGQIAQVIKNRKLFPFFDSAYQGFASGDLDKDAWAVRFFVNQGFEMFSAQSFAKNMGLYNERVGNLIAVLNNASDTPAVKSQLTITIRGIWSNPPAHGARVASYILSNKELFKEWEENIRTMSSRLIKVRYQLRQELERLGAPGSWNHITDQIGMFSYSGLNRAQSERMIEKHHIYMLRSGRMSLCGLNDRNMEYVAKAVKEVLTYLPDK